jgi:nucleotide-binding universal stress UspA family protein
MKTAATGAKIRRLELGRGGTHSEMTDLMRILIGYDGSECAEAALDDLRSAGLPERCEALILSIAEVWLPPPPPSAYELTEMAEVSQEPAGFKASYEPQLQMVEEAKARAARAVSRLKSNFPNWDISSEGGSGSPAWEILFKAGEWKPDLIVVGSHGRSALGRFIMGSVSQRVLAEAECSVRIARGRNEEPGPARIIIGVDGSAGSEAAVRAVQARSWAPQSEVQVVVVDNPTDPSMIGTLIPTLRESVELDHVAFRDKLKAMVTGLANQISSPNLSATGIVAEGDPKHVVVKIAEEWGANSIFVGSTGFSSRLARFLIGSVSSAIAARAHCSVEVIREPKP